MRYEQTVYNHMNTNQLAAGVSLGGWLSISITSPSRYSITESSSKVTRNIFLSRSHRRPIAKKPPKGCFLHRLTEPYLTSSLRERRVFRRVGP